MDCTNCKHSQRVIGSSHHLSCHHPSLDPVFRDPLLLGFERYPVIPVAVIHDKPIPVVILNPHGVINGWAAWPFNFDQIWVSFCLFRLLEQNGMDKILVDTTPKEEERFKGNEEQD